MPRSLLTICPTFALLLVAPTWAAAQTLEQQLLAEPPVRLAADARRDGDATRGAILFYQQYMACTKCHHAGPQGDESLGPNLANAPPETSDTHLVDAVLRPSKQIRQGYQAVTVITGDGKSRTGLIAAQSADHVQLRDLTQGGAVVRIDRAEIDELRPATASLMPAGQVNQLASRQQFLDLLRYLQEITEGGPQRARELEPAPALYAARPLPAYENNIDHAGLIDSLDTESFQRGEAIYSRLCINCHGTHDKPGSLPTSLRFASGKFKNGSSPYAIYQTLTRGFGMMVAQTWMVPQQKYDVIHYIREAYLKRHNPTQYVEITPEFLASLPRGTSRGPEPSTILPWEQMDYGPNLVATYEIGQDGTNFAYKGNAIRLDHGPGGVSRGRHWMIYDYDTLRVAAAWSGRGFIDWHGINFDGRHNIHPRIVGDVELANSAGPGWANPEDGSFDDPRLRGRDNRPYGPLPRSWAHYKGMYYHGNDVIISYTVGETDVLEMASWRDVEGTSRWQRTFNIGPRRREMVLQVADQSDEEPTLRPLPAALGQNVVLFGPDRSASKKPAETPQLAFSGTTWLEIANPDGFDLAGEDFTIVARLKTTSGGTIFAKTADEAEWVPNGQTLFVRGGRLCYDIGWVGVVQSRRRVNDGRWHEVALMYRHETGDVQLFIDGQLDGRGKLKPKAPIADPVVRLGHTADNFPRPKSTFEGHLDHVRFVQAALPPEQFETIGTSASEPRPKDRRRPLVAQWSLRSASGTTVPDAGGGGHEARVVTRAAGASDRPHGLLVAGVTGRLDAEWVATEGNLRLKIPAGDRSLKFSVWHARVADDEQARGQLGRFRGEAAEHDLAALTRGGPARWAQTLEADVKIGTDEGPFAVDVLTHPMTNPWFCRLRLTGLDFFPDGDRAAVSSWDGSIWLVSGLSQLAEASADRTSPAPRLSWRRIASGLFQPLGVKIVSGQIYVTCRDQICILHDLNGDGEIDYFENLNNDHQVTDHFHEFAMGLQVDEAGNFYYAKSARHALQAIVPHHGTLLKVSPDGRRTEIVANGFRAANGVCINPDGTFIVTDQEGHWNPKNRINWVKPGGFYGNMFGYHDVTDPSDDAMEQPLCWITNAFDRSPAELLWVDSSKWGTLDGVLLNLSYGYGQVYVVPHEEVGGQMQGGMCSLPLPRLPTGIMRGRFHPTDGQLYACGMFAWGSNQQQPGGFYRIRRTGRDAHLPIGLQATRAGMLITFSAPLDRSVAQDAVNYQVKTWDLKRTANYGSKHYNEQSLDVTAARLDQGSTRLFLEIPRIKPTWGMEIKYSVRGADGAPVQGTIHNTIHRLGSEAAETSDEPSAPPTPSSGASVF